MSNHSGTTQPPQGGGTCVWEFKQGVWTVIDKCDHANGFGCASRAAKLAAGAAAAAVTVTPSGVKIRVASDTFKSLVKDAFAAAKKSLTAAQKSAIDNPTDGQTFEMPCVKT